MQPTLRNCFSCVANPRCTVTLPGDAFIMEPGLLGAMMSWRHFKEWLSEIIIILKGWCGDMQVENSLLVHCKGEGKKNMFLIFPESGLNNDPYFLLVVTGLVNFVYLLFGTGLQHWCVFSTFDNKVRNGMNNTNLSIHSQPQYLLMQAFSSWAVNWVQCIAFFS